MGFFFPLQIGPTDDTNEDNQAGIVDSAVLPLNIFELDLASVLMFYCFNFLFIFVYTFNVKVFFKKKKKVQDVFPLVFLRICSSFTIHLSQ